MFSSDDIGSARRTQSLLMLGDQPRGAKPAPSKLAQALSDARARRETALRQREHVPSRHRPAAGSPQVGRADHADDRAAIAKPPLRTSVGNHGIQSFSASDRLALQQISASIEEIRDGLRECRDAIRELAAARARRRYF